MTDAGALRDGTATAVWLVAVGCALLLAVGALLVALGVDPDDAAVRFVTAAADRLGLGLAGRDDGVRGVLVTWGLGAIAYLVAGKILDRAIRP